MNPVLKDEEISSDSTGLNLLLTSLVPPYVRKTSSLEAALPWLYLKGVSTGEMANALDVLVSPEVKGFSASTVARLKQSLAEDCKAWREVLLKHNARGMISHCSHSILLSKDKVLRSPVEPATVSSRSQAGLCTMQYFFEFRQS